MAAGMVLGRFLRIKGLQKPIIAVTWLLLLFLGWETGSDREVIGALPSIGLASAALSIGGVAGSCILAWLLWKYMGPGRLVRAEIRRRSPAGICRRFPAWIWARGGESPSGAAWEAAW